MQLVALVGKTKEIDIDSLTKTKAWENHAFVGYQMPQLLSNLSWALSLHAARICFRALSFLAARVRFLAARISLAALFLLYTLSFGAASLFSALALVSFLAAASYKSNSYNSSQQNLFHTT